MSGSKKFVGDDPRERLALRCGLAAGIVLCDVAARGLMATQDPDYLRIKKALELADAMLERAEALEAELPDGA